MNPSVIKFWSFGWPVGIQVLIYGPNETHGVNYTGVSLHDDDDDDDDDNNEF
jgi:hypothetical protein